jgi:hypothetical protein
MNDYLFINSTGLYGIDYKLIDTSNNLANNIFYTSNLIKNNNTFTSNYILQTSNIISNRITDNTVWTKSGNNIYNTNTGNVGIGTASPANPLHIYKASANTVFKMTSYFNDGATRGVDNITFQTNPQFSGGGDNGLRESGSIQSGFSSVGNWSGSYLAFLVPKSSADGGLGGITGSHLGMIITNYGKVGIGKTNPTEMLDVVGTVKATLFNGSGASLTTVNLNDRTTSQLFEGSNLYYNDIRTCNCIRDIGISINPINNTLDILNSNQVDDDTIQAGYGNINFCHIWDEKDVNFPHYPTGNKLKATHSKISGINGRTEVYWHWGDTDLTPDDWMTILPDSYDNGWYDLMEEIVKTNLLAAKDRNTQKIVDVLENTPLKINGFKKLYLLYDQDSLNQSATDYLQVKLATFSGLTAVNGISINTDNTTIGIGTTGLITNELYVKDDSIGTSKIMNDAINTDKLKYSTSFFTYDNTTDKRLIIKDDAITTSQILNNAVNTDKLKYSTNFFKADVNKNLEIKLNETSGGLKEDPSGLMIDLDPAGALKINITNNGLGIDADDITLNIATNKIQIKDLGITSGKIADNAITNAKMADNAITATEIATNAVTTAKINGSAVTTAKIADLNITTIKIADGAITNGKMGSGSVNTNQLVDGAVTTNKIAVDGVTTLRIANDAVNGDKILYNITQFEKDITTKALEFKAPTITNVDGYNTSLSYSKSTHTFTLQNNDLKLTTTTTTANTANGTANTALTNAATAQGVADAAAGAAAGAQATASAAVADNGLQWSAITGLATLTGINTLGLTGQLLIDAINGGEHPVNVKAPLTYYDKTIGLNYNNNELFVQDGRLQLNNVYGRLIDWSFKEYENAFGCYLVGDPITGIKDIYGNVSLGEEYTSFTNDLYDPIFDGGFPTINCKRSAGATYGNRFNYNASGFSDHTKLTVCFYAKIKPEQENQLAPDEEVIFHTHLNNDEDGSGTNNGINIKFNFDYADDMAFKIYIKFNKLGGGTQEEEIFNNWNGTGTNRLLYSYTNARNWTHYAFVITLSSIKVYINGVLHGERSFSTSYTSFYNDAYHVFTGYNQDYGSGVSAVTKQYWNGYLGDIVVINSDLQPSEIQAFVNCTTYAGDQKVFGDRLKYDTNHFQVDIDKKLQLSTNILNDSINTSNWIKNNDVFSSNYVLGTSNVISNRITNTSNWIRNNDIFSSNYVLGTSNIISNRITNTSNWIRNNDIFSSNYIFTSSNSLANRILINSNIISNRITNTSNWINNNDIFSSNYIFTSSNSLVNRIIINSNIISNRITNTSNWINNNDIFSSNYIFTSSNSLANNIYNTSNWINDIKTEYGDFNTKFDTRLGLKTTDDLTQGATNKYSQFITNGSTIYYIGGNIGVGITNPSTLLGVNGTLSILEGNNATTFTENQILLGHNNTETYRHSIKTRHQSDTIHHQNSIDFYLWKNPQVNTEIGNTHIMSITAAGVGIGKTNPVEMLDVNGTIKCTTLNATSGYQLNGSALSTTNIVEGTNKYSQFTTSGANIYYNTGNVGINSSTPTQRLDVVGTVKATTFSGSGASLTNIDYNNLTNKPFTVDTNGITRTGNVGIGSASSASIALRVNGTIETGILKMNTRMEDSSSRNRLTYTLDTMIWYGYGTTDSDIEFKFIDNGTGNTTFQIYKNGDVYVRGEIDATDVLGTTGQFDTIHLPKGDTGKWDIYILSGSTGYGGTSAANDLAFSYGIYDNVGLCWLRHDDNDNDDLDFTGFHKCILEDSNLVPLITSNLEYYQGMIMSANGYYQDLNSSNYDFSSNIKMNSSLPIVALTNTEKDKKVYGVISDIELDGNVRTYNTGKWYYNFNKYDDNRVRLNAVGEGAILITNYKSSNIDYDIIENGDYLCSSPIAGIGMKQGDEFLKNYTVAKITCTVDFNNSNSPFYYNRFKHRFEMYNGKQYPVCLVGCTYHCG